MAIAGQLDHPVYECLYLALAEAEQADFVTADTRLVGEVQATSWEQRTVSLSQYDLSDGLERRVRSHPLRREQRRGWGLERRDALLLFSPEEPQIHDSVREFATRSRRAPSITTARPSSPGTMPRRTGDARRREPRSGKGRTEPANRSLVATLSSNDERPNRLFRALRGELVAKRGIGARRRERLLIRIDPEVERHQGLVVIASVLF